MNSDNEAIALRVYFCAFTLTFIALVFFNRSLDVFLCTIETMRYKNVQRNGRKTRQLISEFFDEMAIVFRWQVAMRVQSLTIYCFSTCSCAYVPNTTITRSHRTVYGGSMESAD